MKKPIMVNTLFIICLSSTTLTKVRIMGTETLSILVTFYPLNPEHLVLTRYLVNELMSAFCFNLGSPEK